tara:strand:- start:4307 stop:4495 length:189 start_codon:yes stop_codon:yes gene_type:complete
MPSTIEEEREYNDRINIIDSLLFLLGLFLFMGCCIYCIIKKGEREEQDRIHYERTVTRVEQV